MQQSILLFLLSLGDDEVSAFFVIVFMLLYYYYDLKYDVIKQLLRDLLIFLSIISLKQSHTRIERERNRVSMLILILFSFLFCDLIIHRFSSSSS